MKGIQDNRIKDRASIPGEHNSRGIPLQRKSKYLLNLKG